MPTEINPECPIHGRNAQRENAMMRSFIRNGDKLHALDNIAENSNGTSKDQRMTSAIDKIDMSQEQLTVFVQSEIAKTLKPLLARLEKNESNIQSLTNFVNSEISEKLIGHIIGRGCASKNEQINAFKADLLHLSNEIRAIRETLATGKASTSGVLPKLTNDDYRRLAPARIANASLAEIVDYINNGGG